ncbi:HNH endonuclease [Sporosarcina limicola]|uniref:HNH endonuclease 5 domain-containing protein n=1 Tax=Sporosarcina limicola TaxID=34101 RepID=A0A927R4B6_9BACL|nr:HNH endonuclease [Sporosarcina limicola]MBE1556006.1 hypothetical protein [Sporosarcina limicola]
MEKHKCIYCLRTKYESEFNKEHVVPRMMGTYQDAFVLSNFQVCQECNSYFSRQIEDKIALDSYEGFLRMQFRDKPMSDGRRLTDSRIRIIGNEGVFKGLPFYVLTDTSNPYRIRFEVEPMVGIISSLEANEYIYYTLENLPDATKEVKSRLKKAEQPIINTGIDRELLERELEEKGYLIGKYNYFEKSITDFYKEPEFMTIIEMKIDSFMRRVCAKTVFNYLCHSRGKEFVLDSSFDLIREYIRYGQWSEELWFRYSKGPVSSVEMPNETAHVVGYMWYPENDQWILCGSLTWFGDITYIFKLGISNQKVQQLNTLNSTTMACFNNVDRTIIEDDAVHIYGGRPDEI